LAIGACVPYNSLWPTLIVSLLLDRRLNPGAIQRPKRVGGPKQQQLLTNLAAPNFIADFALRMLLLWECDLTKRLGIMPIYDFPEMRKLKWL